MIGNTPISDTFQPVDEGIDLSGPYCEARLLLSTATARIYRISRAGKTMLLKTPVDEFGRTLELLKREYRLGVGLSHQHIAAIYTWETDTPVGPGILMEYVDGRTFAAFLAEKPSLKARRRVLDQLLDAVNYIHKHGVTHNDLKPGNIMVSRANDDVKLIDFGLADIDGETSRRQLGGTAGYASPELVARDCAADTRSDIYSIGVVMHDIFGNRYRSVWRKCMAEDPQRRYRNIDSLIRAWRRRKRLPAVVWTAVCAAAVCGFLALGTAKIESLKHEVELYSQSSRQLADTIVALRRDQTDASDSIVALRQGQLQAADSIARLNLQLSEINRERSLIDSLSNAYVANAERVKEKYKAVIQKLRCREEVLRIYNEYFAELDRADSLFLNRNPLNGKGILDKYSVSMRIQGAQELEALAKQLPSLYNLTSDNQELKRVFELIYNGRPWSLNSDQNQ